MRENRIRKQKGRGIFSDFTKEQKEMIDYALYGYSFLGTNAELEEIIPEYIDYLKENRASLLDTGLPKTKFDNPFFHAYCTGLYPTKMPVNIYGEKTTLQYRHFHWTERRKPEGHRVTYDYRWTRENDLSLNGNDLRNFIHSKTTREKTEKEEALLSLKEQVDQYRNGSTFAEETGIRYCEYEKARPLPFLSDEDQKIILANRETILNFKIETLTELYKIISGGHPVTEFKTRLFNSLGKLSSTTLERLSHIDTLYDTKGINNYLRDFTLAPTTEQRNPPSDGIIPLYSSYTDNPSENFAPAFTGSISAFIWAMALLISEAELKTLGNLKRDLSTLRIISAKRGPSIHFFLMKIKEDTEAKIKLLNSLDRTHTMLSEENIGERIDSYMFSLQSRINPQAKLQFQIDAELYNKYYIKFGPSLRSLVDSYCKAINDDGNFKIYDPSSGKEKIKEKTKGHRMSKFGDGWEFVFRGKKLLFTDRKGFWIIATLLRSPNVARWSNTLVGPGDTERSLNNGGENDIVDYDSENFTFSSPDKIIDDKAKKEIKEKLEDLNDELKRANNLGDEERIMEIEDEKEEFFKHLKEAAFSQNKMKDPGMERTRVNVKSNLDKAYDYIKKFSPELAHYLERNIDTGAACTFNSDNSEDYYWEVEF